MKRYVCLIFMFFAFIQFKVSALEVSAQNACVAERITGHVLYSKNGDSKAPMASTTKIMTAIIAIENTAPDDVVTISRNAAMQEGSSAYFKPGDNVRMEDVVYGLMLNSGNDAAVAIAEHISGNEEAFAELMNEKAREIGADNTNFVNPSGLFDDNHYTTAEDLAKIAAYAMSDDRFRKISATRQKNIETLGSGTKLYFSNHNKLLKMYDGAVGVKTGFTKKSGRCLVSAAERDGIDIIAVTLNDSNDWRDHEAMLDYGFSETEMIKLVSKGEVLCRKRIGDEEINVVCSEDVIVPFFGKKKDFSVVIHISDEIAPPINRDERIGICDIEYKNKKIKSVGINLSLDVYKKRGVAGFLDKLYSIIRK